MARRLKEFNFGSRQGAPKYPWDQWTNGEIWEVTHGKDFQCTPGSLVVYLYHKSKLLDMNVSTSIQKGKGKRPARVVFKFKKREADDAEPVTRRGGLKRRQA